MFNKIKNRLLLSSILLAVITVLIVYNKYTKHIKDYDKTIKNSIDTTIKKISFDINKIDNIVTDTVKLKHSIYLEITREVVKKLKVTRTLELSTLKEYIDAKFKSKLITSHIYLINKNNIVYDTSFEKDLNLDMSSFEGATEYIDEAREYKSKIFIANPSFDVLDKKYVSYVYTALYPDQDIVLEIGFFDKFTTIIKDELYKFEFQNSIIKEVEIFADYGEYVINLSKHKRLENSSKQDFIQQRINTKEKDYLIVNRVVHSDKNYSYDEKIDEKTYRIIYTKDLNRKISPSRVKSYVIKTKVDISSFENEYLRLKMYLYITVAVVLLLIFLLYLFLNRAFVKPLNEILVAVHKWHKITDEKLLKNNDEFSQLAKVYNEAYDKQLSDTNTINQQASITKSVLNATNDLIFYKDYQNRDGVYIGCNEAFTEFIGSPFEKIINHNDNDLFDISDANIFRNNDREVIKERKEIYNKEWLTYPNGEKVFAHILKAPIFNTDGTILGIVGISRDMTLELEYQNRLEELNTSLNQRVTEEVDKNIKKDKKMMQQSRLAQMGEMISMIAHQWRQPLGSIGSAIIGMKLQLKSRRVDFKNDEELEKYLEQINSKYDDISGYVQFLSSTIDDFRNFFKPNKERENVSIVLPIKRALQIVEAAMSNKSISIHTEFRVDEKVKIYQNEFMQVILNLLKNAEDNFIERSIQDRHISITTFKEDGQLIISVKDNGGGIREHIMPRIFDPYFSTKNEKNGTGLGLYMSKIIIEEHNRAKLTCQNTKNGVEFKIAIEIKSLQGEQDE